MALWAWLAAGGVIAALLAVDLAVHRSVAAPTLRDALLTSAAWVAAGVTFGIVLGALAGADRAAQYFAGYLLEKSLSIDNVFVFALVLRTLAVPEELHHRVLHYGVVGALGLRAAFIVGGVALLERVSWVLYVFGGLLVLAAARMLRSEEPAVDPDRNLVVRGMRALVPVTPDYVGGRIVTRVGGRLAATPLLVALVAVEVTDVVFAVDSVPAILGVTRDVFVVLTSNAFALLGLRALYFVLAAAMGRFGYLRYGLAVVLAFVGTKMLVDPLLHVGVVPSLAVIVVAVGASVVASFLQSSRAGRDRLARRDPEDRSLP